jgi:hypothetical protein
VGETKPSDLALADADCTRRRGRHRLCVFLLAAAGCAPAGTDRSESAWFEDATERSGFPANDPAPASDYSLPDLTPGGVALFDFDRDGRLDVLLVTHAPPGSGRTHRLLRQGSNGSFDDVTKGSGLDVTGYGQGVAVGDIDNNGWPDACITEFGGARLFQNRGGRRFEDITAEAGIDNPLWGTSAAFFDHDRDGWLDLVIVNYVAFDPSRECMRAAGQKDFCGPDAFPGTVSKLFRNLGEAAGPGRARFEDVTARSGLASLPGPGLGVFCADFDGDRWPDIFVANDGRPNRLWMNQHDGTFVDEALLRGVAMNGAGVAEADMGIAAGDVDGDGLFDIFATHLTEETHTFWRQGPRGLFRDATASALLAGGAGRSTGFGTALADFDCDGDLDLAVANGRVARAPDVPPSPTGEFWVPYGQANHLYANVGGRFQSVAGSNPPFCGAANVARGLACGDIDGDGGLDVVVTTIDRGPRLFRNVAPKRGHWLAVRALVHNRHAYGAEVTVSAGERRWTRMVQPGRSYVSSDAPEAHFGVGAASLVDAIEVVWPDGSEETFPGGPADRLVELRKGEGATVVRP